MKKNAKSLWRARNWRRASQILFFGIFLYFIFRAHGDPAPQEGWQLRSALNPDLLFLGDPFTWVLTVIASRTLIEKTTWLMLAFIGLTLVFGRVFCGWICPLGTLIDGAGKVLRSPSSELILTKERARERAEKSRIPAIFSHRTKYYLLAAVAIVALGGVNLTGLFDPLTILMRATAFALYPLTHWWLSTTAATAQAIPAFAGLGRWFETTTQRSILSPTMPIYDQSWLHLGILLVVLGLTRLQRRWWCLHLCPLGALFGLLARVAPFKRRVQQSACTDCGVCGNACRMEAIAPGDAHTTDNSECLRCMECADRCSREGVSFSFAVGNSHAENVSHNAPFDLTRRGLLTAVASGVIAIPLVRMMPLRRSAVAAVGMDIPQDEFLLRPPNARSEPQFLQMCIRCGECYRVCPHNALHPALFEAGAEGLWTPRLVPRLGACDPSCTLCSQVCPTTAIVPMRPRQRRRIKTGTARVDKGRCLAWSENIDCGVCAEVCPVAPKAIEMRRGGNGQGRGAQDRVAAPVVIKENCIGCGICENRCPVEGSAAIRVTRQGEIRHTESGA